MNRGVRPSFVVTSVAALIVAGCTAAGPTSSAAPTSTTSEAAPTRTPIPSPTPLAGLPADLVGTWETDLRDFLEPEDICSPCGPEVTLTIRAHGSWTVARTGGQASGAFSMDDGQMTFGPNTSCDGSGTYRWEGGGDTLTFTAVEPDECARRQEALDGPTYIRQE
jgi:hypothetical protein